MAAGFTNLLRDHRDYHPDRDSYLAAKLRLFSDVLAPGGIAVINADCDVADAVRDAALRRGAKIVSVGQAGTDARLVSVTPSTASQTLEIEIDGEMRRIRLPLAGSFQASNVLIAAALAVAAGESWARVLAAVEKLATVPGRLQRAGVRRNGAAVYVDYAHKTDALETVLAALRPHAAGRLVAVFGCGGDRDRLKRPEMGAVAMRLADRVIVTDDNPRNEDPAAIRAEVLAGAPGATEIGDRRDAIRAAVRALEAGDVLLVAGKGHETYQIIGDRTVHFDDAEEVMMAIAEIDDAREAGHG